MTKKVVNTTKTTRKVVPEATTIAAPKSGLIKELVNELLSDTKPAAKAAKATAKVEPKPAAKTTSASKVEPPSAEQPVSKRVTPGAKIETWRVVRSQRKGVDGWFCQGGNYAMQPNGRNGFTVGYEAFFSDRAAAYTALAAKRQAAAA